MSTNLLPDYEGGSSSGGGRSPPRDDKGARRRNPRTAPTCRKPSTVIFRRRVRVLDEQDREWLITYESLCSAGQRHTRFAAGWATLCKVNDFKVGETIVFSRWGKRGSGVVVVACDNCALSKKQNKKLCFLPPIQAHLLLQVSSSFSLTES